MTKHDPPASSYKLRDLRKPAREALQLNYRMTPSD